MSEALVAKKLKKNNPQMLIKNISDKFGEGTPDRCCKWKDSEKVIWIELKHIKPIPKKKCKIGLKAKQAAWLEEWKEWGGSSFVLVGIKSENAVAIFENDFRTIQLCGVKREKFHLIPYDKVSDYLRSRA